MLYVFAGSLRVNLEDQFSLKISESIDPSKMKTHDVTISTGEALNPMDLRNLTAQLK